jgi:hypothetical protein
MDGAVRGLLGAVPEQLVHGRLLLDEPELLGLAADQLDPVRVEVAAPERQLIWRAIGAVISVPITG